MLNMFVSYKNAIKPRLKIFFDVTETLFSQFVNKPDEVCVAIKIEYWRCDFIP